MRTPRALPGAGLDAHGDQLIPDRVLSLSDVWLGASFRGACCTACRRRTETVSTPGVNATTAPSMGSLNLSSACSMLAAAACASLPPAATVVPAFGASHVLLFAAGAVAFASNLQEPLHPIVRAVATLVQTICGFEVFGFSVGLTVLAFTGTPGWGAPPWWSLVLAWGMFFVCVGAFVPAAYRAVRSLATIRPQ